jgi:mRNA interferase MazF
MLRGEVWWVDFDPSVGGEIRKTRPALIVSNDAANSALNRLQVIPLTSNTGRLYPSEAIVLIDGKERKVMADQLTTVAKERLKNFIVSVTADEIKSVERIIKIQLGMQL